LDLIDAVPTAALQIKQLNALLDHPGLAGAVGAGLPYASKIPGSPEADFAAAFDQVKGGVFLQAFKGLRGGGQITDVEGAKATAALLRANTAQSETAFKDAIREYMGYIQTGLDRLRQRASVPVGAVPTASPAVPFDATFNTKDDVKQAYQQGKLSKTDANAILNDMKQRGVF
jgi:hypothetical protein